MVIVDYMDTSKAFNKVLQKVKTILTFYRVLQKVKIQRIQGEITNWKKIGLVIGSRRFVCLFLRVEIYNKWSTVGMGLYINYAISCIKQ